MNPRSARRPGDTSPAGRRNGTHDDARGVVGGDRQRDAHDDDDLGDDDFDDEDYDDEVGDVVDRAAPSAAQLAGGAPRELSILLVIAGLAGLWASIQLVRSELLVAADPNAALGCDINILIGCGTFITTWQAHALGISNAILGTAAFGGLLATGLVLLSGGRLGRWFWWLLTAGVGFALVALVFFVYTAFYEIRALCPYCLVVWAVVVPLVVHVPARAAQAGHLRLGERLTRTLVLDRWIITGALYAVVVLYALVHFWDQWMLMAR
ncbi:vitamin K epoxide reductase family protein [Georgenia sp. Z1344]|uniref:vitamin K epoxide reductase family protein n=1 Tax=Georgenia sp. Z1344 TaxID=3416706 RepID=UPI003CF37049